MKGGTQALPPMLPTRFHNLQVHKNGFNSTELSKKAGEPWKTKVLYHWVEQVHTRGGWNHFSRYDCVMLNVKIPWTTYKAFLCPFFDCVELDLTSLVV